MTWRSSKTFLFCRWGCSKTLPTFFIIADFENNVNPTRDRFNGNVVKATEKSGINKTKVFLIKIGYNSPTVVPFG